jgi:leader peptidase (prepilin peptidase)/N-methyltransferase
MMIFLLLMMFVLGTIVGSLLNVCIYRIPLEKSILWPGSRCGHCLQAVRWYDNLPLVSYWLLRGRCRTCGTRFSMRYFFVELFTGLCFAGLFYLEILQNAHDMPALAGQRARMDLMRFPTWQAWMVFIYHSVLASFLIVTTFCDLDYREIPLSLTLTGTVLGLIGATLFPWPWPNKLAAPAPPNLRLLVGLYPWPVWWPLPDWLPAGSWQLGLATGVAGVLFGTIMLRAVRFLFSMGLGVEALGLGDADLMMMAGAFLGWQPLVVAFFVSVLPGLFFAAVHFLRIWQVARSKFTLKASISLRENQPLLELDGQPVSLDDFGPACGRFAQEAHKRRLLLNATELEASVGKVVDTMTDTARQAGIQRVRDVTHEEPPRLLGRVFGFLLGWLWSGDGPTIKIEGLRGNGALNFKIGDREIGLEQLAPTLAELAKQPEIPDVLIDVQGLEKWVDRVIGNIRVAARQAGIERIERRDNAIPFGPALAVGLMLSLLAWPWFVQQAHLFFILFNSLLMLGFAAGCAVLMLVSSYTIRVLRLLRR